MKKILLTVLAIGFLVAPVAFAAEGVANPVVKKMGMTSLGEEIGEKIKEYKEVSEDKKAEAKEQLLERIKERARYAVQNAVRKYEKVQEKINKLDISEDSKSAIAADIKNQINAMNTLRVQIEAATTVEEVKNVMQKTKTQFKYSLGLVRQSIKGVYEDRLTNVLEKSVNIYDKLVVKVEELEEGTTKNDLETLLSQTSSLLVSAETKIETGDLNGAKADLISAKETMSEIVTIYNGLK